MFQFRFGTWVLSNYLYEKTISACVGTLCPTGATCISNGTLCCNNSYIVTTSMSYTFIKNSASGCSDSTSANCAAVSAYCTNSAYYNLMVQYCPATCGFCGYATSPSPAAASATTTASSSSKIHVDQYNFLLACVDLTNPSTGVSDCPSMASYCNNAAYYTLMTQQCPKTCGRCGSTSTTTSSSSS